MREPYLDYNLSETKLITSCETHKPSAIDLRINVGILKILHFAIKLLELYEVQLALIFK